MDVVETFVSVMAIVGEINCSEVLFNLFVSIQKHRFLHLYLYPDINVYLYIILSDCLLLHVS